MSKKNKKKGCGGKCKKVASVISWGDAPVWYEPTQPNNKGKTTSFNLGNKSDVINEWDDGSWKDNSRSFSLGKSPSGGPNPTKVYVVTETRSYKECGKTSVRIVGVFETSQLAHGWVDKRGNSTSSLFHAHYSIKRMTLRYSSMMTSTDW